MELHEQVTTSQQSKKIKELGFIKNSCFEYISTDGRDYDLEVYSPKLVDWVEYGQDYRAYTASELMDMLPESVNKCRLRTGKMGIEYFVLYANEDEKVIYHYINTNLAQALGDMLIYLLENKLLNTSTS